MYFCKKNNITDLLQKKKNIEKSNNICYYDFVIINIKITKGKNLKMKNKILKSLEAVTYTHTHMYVYYYKIKNICKRHRLFNYVHFL